MLKTKPEPGSLPIVVQMRPVVEMTDDEFFEFCRINRDLHIERTAEGDIVIMTPAGGKTGSRNATLTALLHIWAKQEGTGVAFDSSTGFILPNAAVRSPDAAWVRRARLAALSEEQKKRFLPLAPDFVAELRSPTDDLREMQRKMEEYAANGVRLGWLIDPEAQQLFVYRPEQEAERLQDPAAVAGDPELPGFVLEMEEIWEPDF